MNGLFPCTNKLVLLQNAPSSSDYWIIEHLKLELSEEHAENLEYKKECEVWEKEKLHLQAEVVALREQLGDRDEQISKLQLKNAHFKKRIQIQMREVQKKVDHIDAKIKKMN